jgi:hypothetical protein
VVVHEFSHAAFGLPDEYCCDGGYWEVPPILYPSQAMCLNDAANTAWRDCRSYTADDGNVWWRSEDNTRDMMNPSASLLELVPEYGHADWVLSSRVLKGLGGAGISSPSVFAPDIWNWP